MTTKVILYIATSIDGFIATENGSVEWLEKYNGKGEDYGYKEFLESVNTVVMGKTTYEQVLGFGKYPYSDLKGYVFSNKGTKDENVTFVKGDVRKFIGSLDKEKEHRIWLVGGADIFNQFQKDGLIDEYIIFIMPELLGKGIRLFGENEEAELRLIKTKQYDSGVVELHYTKI